MDVRPRPANDDAPDANQNETGDHANQNETGDRDRGRSRRNPCGSPGDLSVSRGPLDATWYRWMGWSGASIRHNPVVAHCRAGVRVRGGLLDIAKGYPASRVAVMNAWRKVWGPILLSTPARLATRRTILEAQWRSRRCPSARVKVAQHPNTSGRPRSCV